jgi:hypothetical protein
MLTPLMGVLAIKRKRSEDDDEHDVLEVDVLVASCYCRLRFVFNQSINQSINQISINLLQSK